MPSAQRHTAKGVQGRDQPTASQAVSPGPFPRKQPESWWSKGLFEVGMGGGAGLMVLIFILLVPPSFGAE